MPKLKLNKPQPRPAKARRAVGSQNPSNNISAHHESQLVGLTDPFSPEAASARYPDQGAGRSLTFTQRLQITLSSDASGTVALAVTPKPNFALIQAASNAGNVTTWPATFSALGDVSTSLINSYGRTFRPTSYGVRIVNTLSATASSGYLILGKSGLVTLGSTTTWSPNNFTTWETHPVSHGGEWHMVGRPRSAAAYNEFDVANFGSNTNVGISQWETIYIGAFGLPASSSCLQAELVFNYEYFAAEDAPIAALAQQQPVYDPRMQAAINEVQANHPPSHKGPQAQVRAFVKREGKKALLKHVLPFVAKKAALALV